MKPSDFFSKFALEAQICEKGTGVIASVSLAQSPFESAWGEKMPGNNMFGIKIGKNWDGEVQLIKTHECGATGDAAADHIFDEVLEILPPGQGACEGKYTYIVNGKFRAYPTPADSFSDHANFLKVNSRYATCFETVDADKLTDELHSLDIHIVSSDECAFPKKVRAYHFCVQLQIRGYSTDPNYAKSLITMIQEHNLTQYDSEI